MLFLNQLKDGTMCEHCYMSVYDTVNQVKNKYKGKNCKVCSSSGRHETGCQATIVASWKTLNEATITSPVLENKGSSDFQPPATVGDTSPHIKILWTLRNKLANFMGDNGISQDQYGFLTLVQDLYERTISILVTAMGLLRLLLGHFSEYISPIIWIFVAVLRFILDSVIGITKGRYRKIMYEKIIVLTVQLFVILVLLRYTVYLLLFPLFCLLGFCFDYIF